jgi:phosphate uptake regulator
MSPKPRKQGFKGRRPTVPEGRHKQLSIRLFDDERAAIDAAAARLGISPGSYVRQIVLNAPVPRQGRRPVVEKKELSKFLGLLGNLASNINQVARALNSGDDADHDLLRIALGSIREMREGVLQALGREP